MFTKEFSALGLGIGESKIYDCLIQKGDASATDLASGTGLGRTNIYEYTESLVKRGLVSDYEHKKKRFFHAASPNELTGLVQRQVSSAKQNELLLAEILPKLLKQYEKHSDLPGMQNLIGDSGYREYCNTLYLQGNSREIFLFIKDLNSYEPPEPRYFSRMQERGVHINLIACKGDALAEFQKRDLKENRTTMVKNISLEMEIAISEDKIFIGNLSSKSFSVAEIQSFAFAKFLRSLIQLHS